MSNKSTLKYNENPFADDSSHQPIATTPPWLLDAPVTNSTGYKQVSLEDNEMDTVHINLNGPGPSTFNPPMYSNSFSSGYPTGYANNPTPSNSNANVKPGEVDPAIPRMITTTRVVNLVLSICMIIISLLAILTTQSATTGVLACYVVVFACLLCCFETHLKQVSKMIALNFGFMYSAKSRAVFMIFIGTIMFSFSLFGKILALCMIGNAFFNIFILFKYPEFDNVQRENATAEIRDFLQSNPAFAQTMAQTGTNFVQSNPGKNVKRSC
eukprot:gene76-80_t